ncbi:MAG: hypothetical protein Q9195_008844 [Heterodermia aff. obscurata]
MDFTSVDADDEWSPLKAVLVGRAGHACFPAAPKAMIDATMPERHRHCFQPSTPFPARIVRKAEEELDNLATVLEAEGIKVYRSTPGIDWLASKGYTGAMPRDGLLVVGNTIIESCFAWSCRSREIQLAYASLLDELAEDGQTRIIRRPQCAFADSLDIDEEKGREVSWVINNSRPAFDAADFMRFGKVLLGQYSHVTNQAGMDYIRKHLPPTYQLEILEVNDPAAMHIDATILPLRDGLLVYNPNKVTETALRAHDVLTAWTLEPYPFDPKDPDDPPLYMTSPWLSLNVLVLGERVVVEASDHKTAAWFQSLGMHCIKCPFRHVNSIGGSFHCATVDLVRQRSTQ